jgi:hypothetical protein
MVAMTIISFARDYDLKALSNWQLALGNWQLAFSPISQTPTANCCT